MGLLSSFEIFRSFKTELPNLHIFVTKRTYCTSPSCLVASTPAILNTKMAVALP